MKPGDWEPSGDESGRMGSWEGRCWGEGMSWGQYENDPWDVKVIRCPGRVLVKPFSYG